VWLREQASAEATTLVRLIHQVPAGLKELSLANSWIKPPVAAGIPRGNASPSDNWQYQRPFHVSLKLEYHHPDWNDIGGRCNSPYKP